MGKRHASRAQRRRSPEIGAAQRHPGLGNRRGEGRKAVLQPPDPRRREHPLPEHGTRSFATFLGCQKEKSFAELVGEFLAPPAGEEPREGVPPPVAHLKFPAPQEELDLHRLTGPAAARKIENFIQTARGRGLLSLRIITGKGLHSEGPAVLRQVAEDKLLELRNRRLVLAFRWDRRAREESGALLVYLTG